MQVFKKTPAINHERDLLSLAYINLGSTYAEDFKDPQKAQDYFQRALAVAEALVAEHLEARIQYQETVEILSKLKAANEIALGGLKDLREAQQRLQALAS